MFRFVWASLEEICGEQSFLGWEMWKSICCAGLNVLAHLQSIYWICLPHLCEYRISQTRMGPTEVKAKSQTRFNGDSWPCLDAIRPPILFSAYSLPSPFGETPNPKSDTLQQTGTSGKSQRLKLGKEGNCSVREWFFRMYCNSCALFYFSQVLLHSFNKDIFLSGKMRAERVLIMEAGPEM